MHVIVYRCKPNTFAIVHVLYLGDVPHHPVNTNEAMEHSRMANGHAETAIDTDYEGH
jgi:hypothetical protein